jgi:lauroyl/myristoyl acyltransferase
VSDLTGLTEAEMIRLLYPPPPWSWAARRDLWRYHAVERLAGLSDLVIHAGLARLPTDRVSAIGVRLGQRAGRARPDLTARAEATLRLFRPDDDAAAIAAGVARHWGNVGRAFAEYARLPHLQPERRFIVDGAGPLQALVAARRPVIVVAPHLGLWDVVAGALRLLGIPFDSFFQRLPSRFRMRLAVRQRMRAIAPDGVTESQLLPPTLAGALRAQRNLRHGARPLLIYVDEWVDDRVHAPSLGRELRLAGNIARAARFSAMTGAAIVPACCLRVPDQARFTVRFSPPLPLEGLGLEGRVAAIDAAIEAMVRIDPEQWLMLHGFRADR